jgi:hypothetical protein
MSNMSQFRTAAMVVTDKAQIKFNTQPLLATCFHAGYMHGLFLTLKMEAAYYSETSVDFQRNTKLSRNLVSFQ